MSATKVICPECRATLKLASSLPAGKKIKCPKCTRVFAIPAEEADGEAAGATPPAVTPKRPKAKLAPQPEELQDSADREDDGNEQDEPRPVRKFSKKRRKEHGSKALMWSMIGGGAALAIGLTTILILVLGKEDKEGGDKDDKK